MKYVILILVCGVAAAGQEAPDEGDPFPRMSTVRRAAHKRNALSDTISAVRDVMTGRRNLISPHRDCGGDGSITKVWTERVNGQPVTRRRDDPCQGCPSSAGRVLNEKAFRAAFMDHMSPSYRSRYEGELMDYMAELRGSPWKAPRIRTWKRVKTEILGNFARVTVQVDRDKHALDVYDFVEIGKEWFITAEDADPYFERYKYPEKPPTPASKPGAPPKKPAPPIAGPGPSSSKPPVGKPNPNPVPIIPPPGAGHPGSTPMQREADSLFYGTIYSDGPESTRSPELSLRYVIGIEGAIENRNDYPVKGLSFSVELLSERFNPNAEPVYSLLGRLVDRTTEIGRGKLKRFTATMVSESPMPFEGIVAYRLKIYYAKDARPPKKVDPDAPQVEPIPPTLWGDQFPITGIEVYRDGDLNLVAKCWIKNASPYTVQNVIVAIRLWKKGKLDDQILANRRERSNPALEVAHDDRT